MCFEQSKLRSKTETDNRTAFVICYTFCYFFLLLLLFVVIFHYKKRKKTQQNHIIWLFCWFDLFLISFSIWDFVWLIFNVNLFSICVRKRNQERENGKKNRVYFHRRLVFIRCCAPTPTKQRIRINSMPNFILWIAILLLSNFLLRCSCPFCIALLLWTWFRIRRIHYTSASSWWWSTSNHSDVTTGTNQKTL